MLKQKDFWVGVLLGIAAYYIYTTHLKGKGSAG
jgi:hypothetical protein